MIGGIFSLIGQGIGLWGDKLKHKRELEASIAKNKQRLAEDEQSNNHDWEMANLQDKDKVLRWVSFSMFTFPFVWMYFDPAGAATYFTTMNEVLPEWYQEVYIGMTGGIWGIAALKNAVPSLVGGVLSAAKVK